MDNLPRMMMNPYPQAAVANLYIGIGNPPIRVYCVFDINVAYNNPDFDPRMFSQSLRIGHPLPYPYTWLVYGSATAIIVKINDLFLHDTRRRLPPTYHIPVYSYDEHAGRVLLNYFNSIDASSSPFDDDVEANQLFDIDAEALVNDIIQGSDEDFLARRGGLTENEIYMNLQVADYCKEDDDDDEEEEDEICAVCLEEFEKNERIGVLECKHQYHPECITGWLIRHNVCPLCKREGLRV